LKARRPRIHLEPSRAEFTELAIQLVKDFNKGLAEQSGSKYCVKDDVLREILTHDIRVRADIANPSTAIRRRAANILVGLVTKKPFCSENHNTAYFLVDGYLHANGITLSNKQIQSMIKTVKAHRKDPGFVDRIDRILK